MQSIGQDFLMKIIKVRIYIKKVSVHRIIICPNYVMDIFRVYTNTCQIKLYNVHVSLTCEDLDALQQNWNPQIHFIYFSSHFFYKVLKFSSTPPPP